MMRPDFETDRLMVFRAEFQPSPLHRPRALFFGVRTDADCPMAVVFATVWFDAGILGNHLELIETSELHRREGLATELWRGIEKQYGIELTGTPTTDAGEGLASHIEMLRCSTGRKS